MELTQRYLWLWLALLVAIPAFAEEPPQRQEERPAEVELHPMEATYGATLEHGVSISGEATRSLEKRDGGRWLYRPRVYGTRTARRERTDRRGTGVRYDRASRRTGGRTGDGVVIAGRYM